MAHDLRQNSTLGLRQQIIPKHRRADLSHHRSNAVLGKKVMPSSFTETQIQIQAWAQVQAQSVRQQTYHTFSNGLRVSVLESRTAKDGSRHHLFLYARLAKQFQVIHATTQPLLRHRKRQDGARLGLTAHSAAIFNRPGFCAQADFCKLHQRT